MKRGILWGVERRHGEGQDGTLTREHTEQRPHTSPSREGSSHKGRCPMAMPGWKISPHILTTLFPHTLPPMAYPSPSSLVAKSGTHPVEGAAVCPALQKRGTPGRLPSRDQEPWLTTQRALLPTHSPSSEFKREPTGLARRLLVCEDNSDEQLHSYFLSDNTRGAF